MGEVSTASLIWCICTLDDGRSELAVEVSDKKTASSHCPLTVNLG
jgi:hypothetical protein